MERQLLARSRFYNGSQSVDELLQSRYSRAGDQKSFLVLKPTGMTNEEGKFVENSSETESGRTKIGKIDKTVQWDSRKLKTSKNERRKTVALLDKKNKRSTRLVFRSYIKQTISNQRKVISMISRQLSSSEQQRQQRQQASCSKLSKQVRSLIEKNNIPKYDDYFDLNSVWMKYIQDLLQLDRSGSVQAVLTKLSSAEYIGAIARIVASKDKTLVNLTGIILYEFKNYFVVLIPNGLKFGDHVTFEQQNYWLDQWQQLPHEFSAKELVGGFKMVEKQTCIFKILVPFKNNQQTVLGSSSTETNKVVIKEDYIEFMIIGPRFNYKPAERSSKKFKNHNVDDLDLLLHK